MKFHHFHIFRGFTHFACNTLDHAIHREGTTETARTASGPGLATAASHARTRAQEEKRPVRRSGIRLPPSLQFQGDPQNPEPAPDTRLWLAFYLISLMTSLGPVEEGRAYQPKRRRLVFFARIPNKKQGVAFRVPRPAGRSGALFFISHAK